MEHPMAADTPEGFVRWRLLEDAVGRTTREAEEALEWLVGQGFLRELPVTGGRPVFVLDHARRTDAEAVLAGAGGERDGGR